MSFLWKYFKLQWLLDADLWKAAKRIYLISFHDVFFSSKNIQ